MPTYNFKEQFVPFVQDGTKRQTVRAYRKDGRLPIMNEPVHLFTGMRTKHCQRLLPKQNVERVYTIFIFNSGGVYLCQPLHKSLAEKFLSGGEDYVQGKLITTDAEKRSKNIFAWNDGFRPEGSTFDQPGEAFALMLDFWKNTHSLPFTGTVTYW